MEQDINIELKKRALEIMKSLQIAIKTNDWSRSSINIHALRNLSEAILLYRQGKYNEAINVLNEK